MSSQQAAEVEREENMIRWCSAMAANKLEKAAEYGFVCGSEVNTFANDKFLWTWPIYDKQDGRRRFVDFQFWDLQYQYRKNTGNLPEMKSSEQHSSNPFFKKLVHIETGLFDVLDVPHMTAKIEESMAADIATVSKMVNEQLHSCAVDPVNDKCICTFNSNTPRAYRHRHRSGLTNTWIAYIHYDEQNQGQELLDFVNHVRSQSFSWTYAILHQPIRNQRLSFKERYPHGKDETRYHKQVSLWTCPNVFPQWRTLFPYAFPENIPGGTDPARKTGHAVAIACLHLHPYDSDGNPKVTSKHFFGLRTQQGLSSHIEDVLRTRPQPPSSLDWAASTMAARHPFHPSYLAPLTPASSSSAAAGPDTVAARGGDEEEGDFEGTEQSPKGKAAMKGKGKK